MTETSTSRWLGKARMLHQDESGITDYAYDSFGNTVRQQKSELGATFHTAYTHDAGNRVVSMAYPDGRTVTYDRDGLGRIVSVTTTVNGTQQQIVTGRTYRADALLVSQTYGNGLNEIRQYDLRGQLTHQFVGSADTRVYAYDANGNLTRKQSLPEAADYAYDPLDRLTRTANELTDDAYTYDPNGNRLSDSDQVYSYTSGSNRLEQAETGQITLDPAGNTVSDGTRSYRYNQAGRLVEVQTSGTTVATYTYNYLGQRTRKVTAQQTILYHYDTNGQLLAETVGSKPQRAYLWAETQPLAQIETALQGGRPLPARLPRARLPQQATTEVLTFLHADHLDTPRLATNANATPVWSWNGEAFGHTAPNEDPDSDRVRTTVNLRFPGQYFDQETGLHYNWNRYYDPRAGRYITSDPIGLAGGLNTYTYALNNPIRHADSTGLLIMLHLNEFSKNPIPHEDAIRMSNFTNRVALTATTAATLGPTAVAGGSSVARLAMTNTQLAIARNPAVLERGLAIGTAAAVPGPPDLSQAASPLGFLLTNNPRVVANTVVGNVLAVHRMAVDRLADLLFDIDRRLKGCPSD